MRGLLLKAIFIIFFCVLFWVPQNAVACPAQEIIAEYHEAGKAQITNTISKRFALHKRDYWIETAFKDTLLPAMRSMSEILSVKAMSQMGTIGQYFDAKENNEAIRDQQYLAVNAYKDYQPDQQFCSFGTAVRTMASTESHAGANKIALSEALLARQMINQSTSPGTAASGGRAGREQDLVDRWRHFARNYCDKTSGNGGLSESCFGSDQKFRINRDLDYERLLGRPYSVEADFADNAVSKHDSDMLALGQNLYAHQLMSPSLTLNSSGSEKLFHRLRGSVGAKRSVAQNSFVNIAALKSQGDGGYEFLAAILKDMGAGDGEILETIGENPSRFAQLELMAKKLYQDPKFIAGLYDSPANVQRNSVAIRAIELMLDRAMYESRLRQEMLSSILLSSSLDKRQMQLGGGQ